MVMQWAPYEVPLTGGLDEKRSEKITMQGRMQIADNFVFDKAGALNKRRGYDTIDLATTLFGATGDAYFMHLADHNGELLILGGDHLYAVLDADNGMPLSRAVVQRGTAYRGNIWRMDIVTSATGEDT